MIDDEMKVLTATIARPPLDPPSLFRSFWQGGFESASHVNRHGVRIDMIARTGHDHRVDEDYAELVRRGMLVAREGIRWHLVDRAGHFDFSSVRPFLQASQRHGVQVLWTLCHYGSPDGVDLFSPRFVDRFARYAGAVAAFVRDNSDEVAFFSPINEVSFLTWAAGHVGYIYPYGVERGAELKRNLVRAIIAAIEAIWAVDSRSRILHCDPIIEVVAPHDRPDLARAAADETASQYEAWDMVAGGFQPELGGHPRYLDVIGANYYHANQWEFPATRIPWDDGPYDDRRISFSRMLERLYHRYHRPLFVSETSHIGAGRGRWIREICEEVRNARSRRVPVEGICLYPVLDRPDWDDPHHWHNSGLWDLDDVSLDRRVCEEYACELATMQEQLAGEGCR
jgi:hypothetical protein